MTKSTQATKVPTYRSGKTSRRFIRNLVWVLVVGFLFLGGQGLRYYFNYDQIMEIRSETEKLYTSALGSDIGSSPFGRLQFEHGKLTASKRIGLDPLSILAALSDAATENLKLEGMTLSGTTGRVRGTLAGNNETLAAYMEALSDNERYLFSLYKSDELNDTTMFILNVEPQ